MPTMPSAAIPAPVDRPHAMASIATDTTTARSRIGMMMRKYAGSTGRCSVLMNTVAIVSTAGW